MSKELPDTGNKIVFVVDEQHYKMTLMMWDDREVVVFEFLCDCPLKHASTEGLVAIPADKVFFPVQARIGKIEDLMDGLKKHTKPFTYLDYNIKKEDFSSIQNSVNVTSKCFYLCSVEDFAKYRAKLSNKDKTHTFVEYPLSS